MAQLKILVVRVQASKGECGDKYSTEELPIDCPSPLSLLHMYRSKAFDA